MYNFYDSRSQDSSFNYDSFFNFVVTLSLSPIAHILYLGYWITPPLSIKILSEFSLFVMQRWNFLLFPLSSTSTAVLSGIQLQGVSSTVAKELMGKPPIKCSLSVFRRPSLLVFHRLCADYLRLLMSRSQEEERRHCCCPLSTPRISIRSSGKGKA